MFFTISVKNWTKVLIFLNDKETNDEYKSLKDGIAILLTFLFNNSKESIKCINKKLREEEKREKRERGREKEEKERGREGGREGGRKGERRKTREKER